MTVLYPEAVKFQGNVAVKAVLSIADVAAPKLATEINAVTSVDLSCYLRDFAPPITLNSGTAPARLCTTIQLPSEGNAEYGALPLRYVYDPKTAPTTDGNKALATLAPGASIFFVVRKGLDARGAVWAATQRVEVWQGRMGKVQSRTRSGDDEFAELEIEQLFIPTAIPNFDAIIAT